jgi:hypothetical protein
MATPMTTSVAAETKAELQVLLAKVNPETAPLGSPPPCVTEASTEAGVHIGGEIAAKQVSRTKA